MVDVVDTAPQAVEVPEIERFWEAFNLKGLAGDPNNPLKWWKVSKYLSIDFDLIEYPFCSLQEHEHEFKLISPQLFGHSRHQCLR